MLLFFCEIHLGRQNFILSRKSVNTGNLGSGVFFWPSNLNFGHLCVKQTTAAESQRYVIIIELFNLINLKPILPAVSII